MTANLPGIPTSEQLQLIAQKFGVRLIVLFGSVARGKIHEESDIDIGVLTDRPITFNKRLKLWYELSSLFRADIDLAMLNHAEPVFGFQVARDGKLLFERDKFVWENWRSYKIRQYWDTKKFRDDLERYLARRVKEMRYASAK
jgi:predicted nucleotidyltransferase